MTQINQEMQLSNLAETHNSNLVSLTNLVGELEDHLIAVREDYRERVRLALAAEAKSRVDLHNAVATSNPSLWQKTKTRIAGRVKYGFRKKVGKMVVADEDGAIAWFWNNYKDDEYEGVVDITHSLNKKALRELPAKDLAKAGIQLLKDSNEVVVADTASSLQKVIEQLRKDGWADA